MFDTVAGLRPVAPASSTSAAVVRHGTTPTSAAAASTRAPTASPAQALTSGGRASSECAERTK